MRRRDERGITLLELIVVLAVASVFLATLAAYAAGGLARATLRSVTYDIWSLTQAARVEAASRNQPCRLVIDSASGFVQVWDGRGTASLGDDKLLRSYRLPGAVQWATPDGSPAISLQQVGGAEVFQAVFASDGTLIAGSGSIGIRGEDRFGRVSVYPSGSALVEHWNGATWEGGI